MTNSSSKDVHVPLHLRVDTTRQVLEVFRNGELVKAYPVSTSKFGLGFEFGSNKTPVGRFVVSEKIGAGVETGAVFEAEISPASRLARWSRRFGPHTDTMAGWS
jgi:hypothetical protein